MTKKNVELVRITFRGDIRSLKAHRSPKKAFLNNISINSKGCTQSNVQSQDFIVTDPLNLYSIHILFALCSKKHKTKS